MKATERKIIRAFMFVIALMGATATVGIIAMPDHVYAKGAKVSGKGNGKSPATRSAKRRDGEVRPSNLGGSKAKAKGENGNPNHASLLGALNAYHANENAFLHASPNSQVGKIAAYRDSMLELAENESALDAAMDDLEAALNELDALDAPARSSDEIQADLENAMAAGDPTDELQAEYDAAIAYEIAQAAVTDLETEIADLEAEITQQQADSDALLADAANKPLTQEIIDMFNALLGL